MNLISPCFSCSRRVRVKFCILCCHANCFMPPFRFMLLPHWCSSDPSGQSATSSQCQAAGMHCPVVHTNLCSGQLRCVAACESFIGIENAI